MTFPCLFLSGRTISDLVSPSQAAEGVTRKKARVSNASQQRESPTQNISSASQQEIQRTDVSRVRLNVRNDERLLVREGVRANALARARSYLLASRSTVEGTQQEKVGRFACS